MLGLPGSFLALPVVLSFSLLSFSLLSLVESGFSALFLCQSSIGFLYSPLLTLFALLTCDVGKGFFISVSVMGLPPARFSLSEMPARSFAIWFSVVVDGVFLPVGACIS